jgi:type I restriction enzyme M protein
MNKKEIKIDDKKCEISNYEQNKNPINKRINWKIMEYSGIVSFLWEKQEFLRDHIKKNKRKEVILPFVILARLDAELDPTKSKVLDKIKELEKQGIKPGLGMDDDLNKITKKKFNNKSEFLNLSDLLTERHDIRSNLEDYVNGFSENIQDIFEHFKFIEVIKDLEKKKILWRAVEHFAGVTKELAKIDNHKMGTVYEELIRKGNEASHETAGDHFTPRDIINLMVTLIFSPVEDEIRKNPNRIRVIYDPACGTGGMLSQAAKFLEETISEKIQLGLVGQDIADDAYATCKSDMMIRGIEPQFIQYGNSLTSEDAFKTLRFDYMLSNPPYGKDWSDFSEEIIEEHEAKNGRYDVGYPRSSDGSFLFLQHMISKMHPKDSGKVSRIAVVLNASPLFTGDAGSPESEIRKWIIKQDMLETIIGLHSNLFYNTPISTYIWILTNKKSPERAGKVQLINAVDMADKIKKSLGDKRYEITNYIDDIKNTYDDFKPSKTCKIFKNEEFGYTRITVERPLRRNYKFSDERIEQIKQETSFENLAKSKKKGSVKEKEEKEGEKLQEKIISILKKADKSKTYNNCRDFENILIELFNDTKVEIKKSIMTAIQNALSEKDESSPPCLNNKDKPVFDTDLKDYEHIPLNISKTSQDEIIKNYFEKEVKAYVDDAEYDSKNNIVGYEIPFTSHFYTYTPSKKLEDVDKEIKKLQEKISKELDELME